MSATFPRALIAAIAARHRIGGELELLRGGMINECWRVGAHVIRIARDAKYDAEAPRECRVAPRVEAAGVRAPRLVAFDLGTSFAPRPYTIFERVPGVLLGSLPPDPARWAKVLREVGRQAARIAAIPVDDELRAGLWSRQLDPRRRLAIARERGAVDQATAGEIAAWLDEAEPGLGAPAREVFLHNDLHPWNLLVDPDRDELTGIIDWGDAGLGDPAYELTSMPLFALPAIVEGYREAGGPADDALLRRAHWLGMTMCLWEIVELDPGEFDRRWWRMPPGGWAEARAYL